MRLIVFDFETYYDSKQYTLSKMSAIDYVRDPRFHVLCLGYSVNGAPAVVVEHEAIPDTLRELRLEDKDTLCIGHNSAGFDNLILSEVYGIRPARMSDTIHMACWCGVARVVGSSLAKVAEYLGVGEKGTGTVMSDGKATRAAFIADEWAAFKDYCANDVMLTTECVRRMLPYFTEDALMFSDITCHMATEPQFVVNPALLQEYIATLDREEAAARFRLQEIFAFSTQEAFMKAIRSAATFCTMLRSLGVEPPMKLSEKQSATRRRKMEAAGEDISSPESWQVYAPALSKQDEEFLELQDHPDPRVRQLVQARLQHNTSIPRARALALLQTSGNGARRVPVMLKCFSAHTSRYGAGPAEGKSDGVQFQNLAKRNKAMLPLRQAIRVPQEYVVLSVDSSQIEARCLAYEAGELGLLQQFSEGRDPYAELAANFTADHTADEIRAGAKAGDSALKLLRNVAKTFVLGGGYGVGWKKVAANLWQNGLHLEADKADHGNRVRQLHALYRANNPHIVRFWDVCQGVVQEMAAGRDGWFGGPNNTLFHYTSERIAGQGEPVPCVVLPSGYRLWYPRLRMEVGDNGAEFVYDKILGKNIVSSRIYGSMLTENLTQAFAFQILMWQACQMRVMVPVACNIHDAFVTVVHKNYIEAAETYMLYWMRKTPKWAEGLPLDAEAEYGEDFTIA